MEEFKLRLGVDPPDPGDLVGISYGGAGMIYPSVFIESKRGNGHFIVKHYALNYWGSKKLPEKPTIQWLRKNADLIYGERVPDRIIHADPRCLSETAKEKYHVIKSLIKNEYKNYWATDSIKH